MGETASYSYYSDGLRASKAIGSDTTRYYYNGDNVINETLNGNSYATNVLGVDGYISRRKDGTTGYLFKNAHGDVVLALDQSKNMLADYTYDAWGEAKATDAWGKPITTVWGESNPIRYNGQYYDTESGMTYLRARYYDSGTRRFITEDPAKDGVNWYAYAGNNPVMFVDSTGYITEAEMQMYENGQMAPGAYTYLMYCTYKYYLANDDNERNIWSSAADDFRDNHYTDANDGYWNSVIEGMSSRPSGTVSAYEHYYRNNLNIEFSYDELMKLNEKLSDNMKWETVAAKYHQNHTVNGQDNIKYVSGCGHFEVVYNANNELQNQYNNTDDMGTYNYSASNKISGYYGHYIYDMKPYYDYGNVPESSRRVP